MSTLAGFRGRFADGSKRALLGKKRQQDFEQNFILVFSRWEKRRKRLPGNPRELFFFKKIAIIK